MPVAERVIERIVERALPTYTIAYPPDGGGVTEAILNDRLDQLENKLSNRIFSLSASLISVPNSLPATGGVTNTIALTQRIDNLNGTDISNPTITGGTITDATISGGNITATALSGTLGVGSGGTGLSTAPRMASCSWANPTARTRSSPLHLSASAAASLLVSPIALFEGAAGLG